MIKFIKVILFINILLMSSMSYSEPIVVLEYRGANYKNEYVNVSVSTDLL